MQHIEMAEVVTVETFDPCSPSIRINSPRSIDACRRKGIRPEELRYLSLDEYRQKELAINVPPAVMKLRWEHYEKSRGNKVKTLVDERRRIIEEEKAGAWKPASSSCDRRFSSYNNSQSQDEAQALRESEKKQLDKMRRRQKVEVQQIRDQHQRQEEIELRNEEKARAQQLKEEARQRELAAKKREMEDAKRKREAKKLKQQQHDLERNLKRKEEMSKKEEEREVESKRKEEERRREIKEREESQRKKQEHTKKNAESVLMRRQLMFEQKKTEMDQRDKQRNESLQLKRIESHKQIEQKRLEAERKLERIRRSIEMQLDSQRERFQEKERQASAKREETEKRRERQKEEAKAKEVSKAEQIEKLQEKCRQREESKNQTYLLGMKQHEENYAKRQELAKKQQEEKKKQSMEKEDHMRKTLIKMDTETEVKNDEFMKTKEQNHIRMLKKKEKRREEKMLKNEEKNLQFKDRVEAMRHIEEADAYEREKLMNKILDKEERLRLLNEERMRSIKRKEAIKRQMEKEKEQILQEFEKSKKNTLSAQNSSSATQSPTHRNSQGVDANSRLYATTYKESNSKAKETEGDHNAEKGKTHYIKRKDKASYGSFAEVKTDPAKELEELKRKLSHNLKLAIMDEERNERKREQMSNKANENDKKQLEHQFKVERQKAAAKIDKISKYSC